MTVDRVDGGGEEEGVKEDSAVGMKPSQCEKTSFEEDDGPEIGLEKDVGNKPCQWAYKSCEEEGEVGVGDKSAVSIRFRHWE